MAAPTAARPDVFHRRALEGKLVAALVGVSANRLASWRRRGLLHTSPPNGRRDSSRLYSWIDYQRARALAALLEQNVSNRRLSEGIAALDAAREDWWKLALPEFHEDRAIPCGGDADPTLATLCTLHEQGPLGRLYQFGEHVSINPRVQDGYPVVRGRRIETEMLGTMHDWGRTTEYLAERFLLTPEQVEAAIAFERALAS